jgi:hypothetical protein
MSGDFTYVWDAALHGVPETLEHANQMFEHFHAVAREHRTFEKLPKMAAYTRALSDYYKQHDLDRHNRPEFEHIDRGVLIIEEGLTFGSAQHYHAVQLAVAQGLVFFEVDADMAFLPDGRVLPEEEQARWQQHGLLLAQEASKPADQVFPGTEKELVKRLYNAMDSFISKHAFVKSNDAFSIVKKLSYGELKSSIFLSVKSMEVMVDIPFTIRLNPLLDATYSGVYWSKLPYVIIINMVDMLESVVKEKSKNVIFYSKIHRMEIVNKDLDFLTYFLRLLPDIYESFYYKLQDTAWVNQLVNHNNFHFDAVIAHPDLRLILAAVNNDPCFDQIVEEGRKDKVLSFMQDKENPCPDEAAAEQKYAEYVEYVRNMKTVPWQLEEILPEYQVKRPEGLLLVHELDIKLKENEVYNTGFTLHVDGVQQVFIQFVTDDDSDNIGVHKKVTAEGIHLTFENLAEASDLELPEPQLLGTTASGVELLMSFKINTKLEMNKPQRHITDDERGFSMSSILSGSVVYELRFHVFIKP